MAEICDCPGWVYAYFLGMAFFAGIGVRVCVDLALKAAIREQKT